MKTQTYLIISFLALVLSSVANAECGDSTPRFCTGENVMVDLYGHTNDTAHTMEEHKIVGVSGGNYALNNLDGFWESSWLSKMSGCGATVPKFCVGEEVMLDLYGHTQDSIHTMHTATVTAVHGAFYIFSRYPGLWESTWLGKTTGCGNSTPSYCVGEYVNVDLYGHTNDTAHTIREHQITSIRGADYSLNDLIGAWESNWLSKERNGCRDYASGLCPGNVGTSSLVSVDTIADNLLEIATVVPEGKAKVFRRLAEYSNTLKWEIIEDMLIVLGYQYVTNSTSEVMQKGFAPAYTKAYSKLTTGVQDFSQIEPSLETLQVAIEVLKSAVEQSLNSATPAPGASAMMGELANISAETRFLAKANRLQQFVLKNNEALLLQIQDPHSAGIAGMTQVIVAWLSKI